MEDVQSCVKVSTHSSNHMTIYRDNKVKAYMVTKISNISFGIIQMFEMKGNEGKKRNTSCSHVKIHIIWYSVFSDLPGDGIDWVNQHHHKAKEEGALPFHKLLLEKQGPKTFSQSQMENYGKLAFRSPVNY